MATPTSTLPIGIEGPIAVGQRFVWQPYLPQQYRRLEVVALEEDDGVLMVGAIVLNQQSPRVLWNPVDHFRASVIRECR